MATMSPSIPSVRTEKRRRISSFRRRAAAVVAAIAASTVTWVALTNIPGLALRVPTFSATPPLTSPLGLGQVIVTTLIAGILAWGFLAGL